MAITLNVNGAALVTDATPDTPLMWVLREELGFTSVKFGCGAGVCGACTVHIEGVAARSCVMQVGQVGEAAITTLEGLARAAGLPEDRLHPIQTAWIDHQVPQCGYCQPGMMMAAAALLHQQPRPTDASIDQSITNLCRCGTYPRVRRAIHACAGSEQ